MHSSTQSLLQGMPRKLLPQNFSTPSPQHLAVIAPRQIVADIARSRMAIVVLDTDRQALVRIVMLRGLVAKFCKRRIILHAECGLPREVLLRSFMVHDGCHRPAVVAQQHAVLRTGRCWWAPSTAPLIRRDACVGVDPWRRDRTTTDVARVCEAEDLLVVVSADRLCLRSVASLEVTLRLPTRQDPRRWWRIISPLVQDVGDARPHR
mmetsp:Transcript_119960/g.311344  ORF Transcript_119960/g.311344 Transcript_119960/m.311344 type:complete len:207 (-) Transcript_119960:1467-2087(-)